MGDYKTFTNKELENELERLNTEYQLAQKATVENYQLMLELAQQYGEANEILSTRTGKKKNKEG